MKKLFFLLLCFSFPALAIECPSDQPMEKAGKCYSCEDWDNDYSKEECGKCPEFRKFKDGLCIFTRSPDPKYPLMQFTAIGESDRFIQNGTVFDSCDTKSAVRSTPENCAQCPNRKYENGECVLSECPQGYFRGLMGNCFKCSTTGVSETSGNYEISKEECDKCPERVHKDGLCILKECPKEAPIRQDGRCLDCGWRFERGEIEESECLKCPNRKYENGECVRKYKEEKPIDRGVALTGKEPLCQANGGSGYDWPDHVRKCYDCSKNVVLLKEKLKEKTFSEIFSEEEIDYYLNFIEEDKNQNPLFETRVCFSFEYGMLSDIELEKENSHYKIEEKYLADGTPKEVEKKGEDPEYYYREVYGDNGYLQEKSEKKKEGDVYNYYEEEYYDNGQLKRKTGKYEEDYEEYYKNGQLKARRVTIEKDKLYHYESYYDNGQLRVREVHPQELSEGGVSSWLEKLEEYYKNGQLYVKAEKGSSERALWRNDFGVGYLHVPYEMYYKNGKLKEKMFKDGTIEKYWENGNLKTKCDPATGGEWAREQCCHEYDENGEGTGQGFCSRRIV